MSSPPPPPALNCPVGFLGLVPLPSHSYQAVLMQSPLLFTLGAPHPLTGSATTHRSGLKLSSQGLCTVKCSLGIPSSNSAQSELCVPKSSLFYVQHLHWLQHHLVKRRQVSKTETHFETVTGCRRHSKTRSGHENCKFQLGAELAFTTCQQSPALQCLSTPISFITLAYYKRPNPFHPNTSALMFNLNCNLQWFTVFNVIKFKLLFSCF